jgi:hypothetical protein
MKNFFKWLFEDRSKRKWVNGFDLAFGKYSVLAQWFIGFSIIASGIVAIGSIILKAYNNEI